MTSVVFFFSAIARPVDSLCPTSGRFVNIDDDDITSRRFITGSNIVISRSILLMVSRIAMLSSLFNIICTKARNSGELFFFGDNLSYYKVIDSEFRLYKSSGDSDLSAKYNDRYYSRLTQMSSHLSTVSSCNLKLS
jgi:hypothetical protein